MIAIQYPLVFLCIPFLLWLWYFLDYKNIGKRYPNPLIQKYSRTTLFQKFLWLQRWILIVLVTAIFAHIEISYTINKKIPESKNIFIVLDISRSMLAEDILPSRIETAKKVITDFVFERKDDNIGLIIFAGKPFTVISPSTDINGIIEYISSISTNFINQEKSWLSGTNIWDALLLAYTEWEKILWEKNIILITDGSANIWSNPLEAMQIFAEKNIPIFTIGIGGQTGLPLFYTDINRQKQFFYDENGEKIVWDLDKNLLQKIALTTNGEYFDSENILWLENAIKNINTKIGNNFIETSILQKIALTPICIILILFFLISEYFCRKNFYKKYKIID